MPKLQFRYGETDPQATPGRRAPRGGRGLGRTSRGLVTRPRSNTFDLAVLFLAYAATQAAASALLVRLFPAS